MIVVVGIPAWRQADPGGPAGLSCRVATAAAARGAAVQLVGRVGDDPTGDALLLALGRLGIGHAAVLRDPVRPTALVEAPAPEGEADLLEELPARTGPGDGPRLEAADVSLGLSYIVAFSVLVVADDVPVAALPAAVAAAEFAGAQLVVMVPQGRALPEGLPPGATVLAAPDAADDGEFAALVGAYAAGLDAGLPPGDAFGAATRAAGAEALQPSA